MSILGRTSCVNYMNATTTLTGNIVNNSDVSGQACTTILQDADPGVGVDYEIKSWTCTGQQFSSVQGVTTADNLKTIIFDVPQVLFNGLLLFFVIFFGLLFYFKGKK